MVLTEHEDEVIQRACRVALNRSPRRRWRSVRPPRGYGLWHEGAYHLGPKVLRCRVEPVSGGGDRNRPEDLLPRRGPTVETALRVAGKGRGKGAWVRVAQDDLVIRLARPPHEGVTLAGPIARPHSVTARFKTSAVDQHHFLHLLDADRAVQHAEQRAVLL